MCLFQQRRLAPLVLWSSSGQAGIALYRCRQNRYSGCLWHDERLLLSPASRLQSRQHQL
ncbi:hypothetical protein E6C60_0533 [Paenibacillus algicola]|uniref:Uncharacterized protein n=1 Tax=Paenibacillus algicola TaxID=2565926 RepID=A0A4P8XFS5_9BACL|nr:hypothetical protein E6C60_0533 [Paenibacillus algicola]